jgi:hypothetical protein
MFAGFYAPEDGGLRLKWSTLYRWAPEHPDADDDNIVEYLGVIVQEYDHEGYDHEEWEGTWRDLCPLVDLPVLYPELVEHLPSLR